MDWLIGPAWMAVGIALAWIADKATSAYMASQAVKAEQVDIAARLASQAQGVAEEAFQQAHSAAEAASDHGLRLARIELRLGIGDGVDSGG